MSDPLASLWLRAMAGETDAWNELFRTVTPQLYAVVRSLGASPSDSEELVQETWLRALKTRSFNPQRGKFEAWICTIAANLCREAHRKRSRTTPVAALDETGHWNPEPAPSALQRLFVAEQRVQLEQCLDQLDVQDRQIVRLRFWQELPHAEIGRQLDLPESVVRARCYRAVRKLSACMGLNRSERI